MHVRIFFALLLVSVSVGVILSLGENEGRAAAGGSCDNLCRMRNEFRVCYGLPNGVNCMQTYAKTCLFCVSLNSQCKAQDTDPATAPDTCKENGENVGLDYYGDCNNACSCLLPGGPAAYREASVMRDWKNGVTAPQWTCQ